VPIGEHAEQLPHRRSRRERHADEQCELRVGQAVSRLDLDVDDGEDRAYREAADIPQGPDGKNARAQARGRILRRPVFRFSIVGRTSYPRHRECAPPAIG